MRMLIALGSLAGGAALIVAGWLFDETGYWGAASLEVGAAMLLVAPLVYIERLLERRIATSETRTRGEVESVRTEVEGVRQEVAEARRRVDELQGEVAEELREEDNALLQRIDELGESISFDDLHGRLVEAAREGFIAGSGIRVPVPGGDNRMAFTTVALEGEAGAGSAIWCSLQGPTGAVLSKTVWQPGEAPGDFWKRVVRDARREGVYESGLGEVGQIVRGMSETLRRAVELRSGERNREVGPIVELLPSGWAVTDDGLDWAGDDGEPYRFGNRELNKIRPASVTQFAVTVMRKQSGWSEAQRAGWVEALTYAFEHRHASTLRAVGAG